MAYTFDVIDKRLESGKKAMYLYIAGFIISLLLTLLPYYIVTRHVADTANILYGIAFFGVAQLLAQVLFFLHLPAKVKPYWNLLVFFFTLLIVSFLVVGTLWIMYHLNYNMMGQTPFNSNEGYIPQ